MKIRNKFVVEKFPNRTIGDICYHLKLSFKMFKHFFWVTLWYRSYDWTSTIKLIYKSIELQKYYVLSGNEIESDAKKNVERIDRLLELIDNVIDDDYQTRCGYDYDYDLTFDPYVGEDGNLNEDLFEMKSNATEAQKLHNDDVREKAKKLEKKEWDELFRTLKKDMKNWW